MIADLNECFGMELDYEHRVTLERMVYRLEMDSP